MHDEKEYRYLEKKHGRLKKLRNLLPYRFKNRKN